MTNENHPPQNADLRWDENQQPISNTFDDVYFSRESGLDESRYVFIEQNNLVSRWQTHFQNASHFTVAETGFGTGLNFLCCWQKWLHFLNNREPLPYQAHLHFISIEKYPLARSDLKKSLDLWPELKSLSLQLINDYPPINAKGIHKLQLPNITLTLFFGDVLDGLQQLTQPGLLGLHNMEVNAWFLDGFAPAKNPEMWRPDLFEKMALCSADNASFATFTAAGSVKRDLQKNGFNCTKVKGFGRKREMLSGTLCSRPGNSKHPAIKWPLLSPAHTQSVKTAIVIGGGIAGCHTAYALAQRGLKVTLIEKKPLLAQGASSNQRGILYTRLSPHQDPLSQFNLVAFLFACRFYDNEKLFAKVGDRCGVLHLSYNEKTTRYYAELAKQFSGCPEYLHLLDQKQAEKLAGISLNKGGLFLPKAGWLNPQGVCEQLASHSNIHCVFNNETSELRYSSTGWQAWNRSMNTLTAEADIAVIANAQDALTFSQTRHLPMKAIRGQVSYLPSPPSCWPQPKIALCADGYLAPYQDNGLCVGASFNLENDSSDVSKLDHMENLKRLQNISKNYHEGSESALASIGAMVGFRTTTPDYFPIVGPVAHHQPFAKRFRCLSKKANADIDEFGDYHPGLFCLLGLGSRGLAYAPLIADALASTICGEALPVSQQIWRHIHPARFIIRNLIRNKPVP